MSTSITAEFNDTLAHAQVEAVKVLTHLMQTETDRTELRQLATILVRIRAKDPATGLPATLRARRQPGRADTAPHPLAPQPHTDHLHTDHQLADLPPADTAPRLAPLRARGRPPAARSPESLMLAAASGVPLAPTLEFTNLPPGVPPHSHAPAPCEHPHHELAAA